MQTTGEFEVTLQPLDPFAKGSERITLGRMSIDKTFRRPWCALKYLLDPRYGPKDGKFFYSE